MSVDAVPQAQPIVPPLAIEQAAGPVGIETTSLEDLVSARARALIAARAEKVVVPLPFFEDLFVVQYRRLTGLEQGKLNDRITDISDTGQQLQLVADTLINACEDILQVLGNDQDGQPQYRSTGRKWSTATIQWLFKHDFPEGTTVRNALLQVVDAEDLSRHALLLTSKLRKLEMSVVKELPGESAPSTEG